MKDGSAPARTPPDDGLSLAVDEVVWTRQQTPEGKPILALAVSLANGTDASASLAPELFHLTLEGGLEVTGGPWRAAPGDCSSDLSVSPGSTAGCTALFGVGSPSKPSEVLYREGDGREARSVVRADPGPPPVTPFESCSDDAECVAPNECAAISFDDGSELVTGSMCTRSCTDDESCPDGSGCFELVGTTERLLCYRECADDFDCAPGFRCVDTSFSVAICLPE